MKIEPIISICPRCGEKNITTELNVEEVKEGTLKGTKFIQNYIRCKSCGYYYCGFKHLEPKNQTVVLKEEQPWEK